MNERQAKVGNFFLEELKKWSARTIFAALMVGMAFVFTPLWDQAQVVWNSPQVTGDRLQSIETRIATNSQTLADMREDIRRATGEDRVIRQTPGLSYVEEPVHQGENVTLMMVAERTKLGRDCLLTDWTPLFTDETNVTIPGQRARAGGVRRQIADRPSKLRIEMIPPDELKPGRIELYLVLVYTCAGSIVPERSDVVTYRLLPGPD